MDINLPLNANLQIAIGKTGGDGLNLKLNQLLEAKVVDTQIMLDTLTLKVSNKTLTVQADRPLTLQSGQSLQLQVVKLLPQPEFKIVASPLASQSISTPTSLTQDAPLLKWINSTAAPTPPTNVLNQVQVGQQIKASIVDIANNKIILQLLPESANTAISESATGTLNQATGKLLLTLDQKQLTLPNPTGNPSSSNIKAGPTLGIGTELTLQVVKTGNSPTFAILPTTTDNEQKIIEAFKQLLPIQASPAPLLNHLQHILPALLTDASVAETLKNLAQRILSGIALKPQLTEATQLKQAVGESGLFLESKLTELLLPGKPDTSLQDDFKFKLGKLIQLLNQELAGQTDNKSSANSDILKESLQKAQAALAKLTLDQLNSLPKNELPKQGWTLELPFFHNGIADSVKLEIEREKTNNSDSQQKNWAVSITITPPDLATIHCRISCYDGSVNTRFWSEAADTVDMINAHLDYLKQQFEHKGLTTGFMEAHQGLPAQTDSIKTAMPHLLSEKA